MFELDNRPKCTDSQTAVEEWLKTNQPKVLPSFGTVKPRTRPKVKYRHTMKEKASFIIGRISHNGLTKGQFDRLFKEKSYDDDVNEVKEILKNHYGLRLKIETKVNPTGKAVKVVRLAKMGN